MTLEERILTSIRDRPVSDKLLYDTFTKLNYTEEEIHNAVSKLHADNKIRWIAFRGYVIGGRPNI